MSQTLTRFYNNWAEDFDKPDFMTQGEEPIVMNLCGAVKGLRILEPGAGTGRLTEKFSRAGAFVYATEPAAEMLGVLRRKLGAPIDRGTVVATQGDWRLMQDSETQYDLIVLAMLIDHVRDVPALFRACRKCLVPRGRIVLSSVNPAYQILVRGSAVHRENNGKGEAAAPESVDAHPHLISEVLGAASDHGFVLRRMLEATIDDTLVEDFPALDGQQGYPHVYGCLFETGSDALGQ